MISQLLINEPPLQVLPTLAQKIGLNEAIVLQQLHYWLNPSFNKNFIEDRYWVYNSYDDWQEQFKFWSKNTIKRTITFLEEQGFLITSNFNQNKFDHKKWYSINYEELQRVEMWADRSTQNGPIEELKMGRSISPDWGDGSAQLEPIEEPKLRPSLTENTNRDYTKITLLSSARERLALRQGESEEKEEGREEEEGEKQTINKDFNHNPVNVPSEVEEMVKTWNETLRVNHKIELSESRILALQACFRRSFQDNLENWRAYCQKISRTPFLMGYGSNGWKVNLDWAIKPFNITKVLEGSFYFCPRTLTSPPSRQAQPLPEARDESELDLTRYGDTWAKVCEQLITKIGRPAFVSWIRALVPEQIESANPVIKAPTAFHRDWVERYYLTSVRRKEKSVREETQLIKADGRLFRSQGISKEPRDKIY